MSQSRPALRSTENVRVMTANGWTSKAKIDKKRDAKRKENAQKAKAQALESFRAKCRAKKEIVHEDVVLGQRLNGTVQGYALRTLSVLSLGDM